MEPLRDAVGLWSVGDAALDARVEASTFGNKLVAELAAVVGVERHNLRLLEGIAHHRYGLVLVLRGRDLGPDVSAVLVVCNARPTVAIVAGARRADHVDVYALPVFRGLDPAAVSSCWPSNDLGQAPRARWAEGQVRQAVLRVLARLVEDRAVVGLRRYVVVLLVSLCSVF